MQRIRNSNWDFPFQGARKQRITNHMCSLLQNAQQSKENETQSLASSLNSSRSSSRSSTAAVAKQNQSGLINLPKQMKLSPFNDNNYVKKPQNRPILKLLFSNTTNITKTTNLTNTNDFSNKTKQQQQVINKYDNQHQQSCYCCSSEKDNQQQEIVVELKEESINGCNKQFYRQHHHQQPQPQPQPQSYQEEQYCSNSNSQQTTVPFYNESTYRANNNHNNQTDQLSSYEMPLKVISHQESCSQPNCQMAHHDHHDKVKRCQWQNKQSSSEEYYKNSSKYTYYQEHDEGYEVIEQERMATFKPLQLSQQLREIENMIKRDTSRDSRGIKSNYHNNNNEEQNDQNNQNSVSYKINQRLSSAKKLRQQNRKLGQNNTKFKDRSCYTKLKYQNQTECKLHTLEKQQMINDKRKSSLKKKRSHSLLSNNKGTSLSSKNYLEGTKPKTKYEKILDRFYQQNKELLVIQAKGGSSSLSGAKMRSSSCKSVSSKRFAQPAGIRLKTSCSQSSEKQNARTSILDKKIKEVLKTEQKERLSMSKTTRKAPMVNNKQFSDFDPDVIGSSESNRFQQISSLRKTFESSGKLKQRLQKVKTQPIQTQNCQYEEYNQQQHIRREWMKMTFDERQKMTLNSRKLKQKKGKQQKQEKQLAGCTFKPKLTEFPASASKRQSQPYKSYAKLYLEKIKGRKII